MRFCVSLILVFMVTGCGFHLRGSQGYELNVSRVHVSAANVRSEFSQELERALTARGIETVLSADAEYTIHISSTRTTRRAVAISADISVSEYELRMQTVFQVTAAGNVEVIPVSTLVTERIYSFNRSSLVGSSEEEKILKREMRRDVANQILRRFSATLRTREAG